MELPQTSIASEAEMVAVRMFGEKFTTTKDNLMVTAYKYNGKIYVDGVKVIGPRLVKSTPAPTGTSEE